MKTRATYQVARLAGHLKPFKLHWFPTLGSTNSHAARMRREGRLLAPAVVLTGRQTAGRGRGSNVWSAPPGVVTVTFVLPAHDTLPAQHVPLLAGLAVRDAVAELGAPAVGIKWPNDLWHADRKLAGLLCERIDRVDLVGIGINANVDLRQLPSALARSATSLAKLLGHSVDQTALLITLARHLLAALSDARASLAAVHGRLVEHDVLRGRLVRVQEHAATLDGRCEGIDAHGRLLVTPRGQATRAIVAGSVRLLDG